MRRLVVLLALVLSATTVAGVADARPDTAVDACQVLQPEDVRYDAPTLTGTPAPFVEICYQLPDGAGTVYTMNLNGSGVYAEQVVDATGAEACEHPGHCRLEGEAPFELRMLSSNTPDNWYDVQVFRMTGDHGCPETEMRAFGSDVELSGTYDGHHVWCWSFDRPAGSFPYVSVGASGSLSPPSPFWEVYDAEGRYQCYWAEPDCEAPTEGSRSLMLVLNQGGGPGGFRLTVGDAASEEGCRPSVDTSWNGPVLPVDASTTTQMHCWRVSADPGDRVAVGVASKYGHAGVQMLDAEGHPACNQSRPACFLEGPAPYRIVSVAGSASQGRSPVDGRYAVALRSLEPDAGCPRLTPGPFSMAADDRHPGIGCRQFDVVAGRDYYVHAVDPATGVGVRHTVLAPDNQPVCSQFQGPCKGLPPGRYHIITDLFRADTVTVLHDDTDLRGCQPLASDMTEVVGAQPVGAVDCFRLTDLPGDEVEVIRAPEPQGATPDLLVRLVDAAGEEACEPFDGSPYCALAGTPPFRMLVGHGVRQPYVVALLSADQPPPCITVEYGARSGRVLRFGTGSQIICVRAPEHLPESHEELVHVMRSTGNGGMTIANYPGEGLCGNRYPFSEAQYLPVSATSCDVDDFGEYRFFVVGDGREQSAYVARFNGRPPAVPGITKLINRTRPTIRGIARPGRVVRVSPGRWTPASRSVKYSYRWSLGGKVVRHAQGKRLKIKPAYVGRRLKVRVTASAPTLYPGSAKSRAVTVRRR